ncbi:hypothetical protein Slin_2135 [Spirosoma linguale DSM 74]|uniref:Uncharacterized protein n=1 Tax=Spirosoma linguale (strain ATCC 33905 / DSM 74 / LMG 10896 / Claus 1) TaxID=504472 RepID=D2QDN5_SPILD|nr:hypothetical protein Slin_2135 [Spirosoma linguale DSM 74]
MQLSGSAVQAFMYSNMGDRVASTEIALVNGKTKVNPGLEGLLAR